MSYIGKIPATGNFVKLDAITCSSTNTYNLLNGGVAFTPESVNHMLVSLNGVIQSPTTAYTVSGSQITFIPASGTLSSSDVIDFIMVYGNVLDIGTPSDNTVTASKLTTDSVQTAKIVDDAVTKAKVNFISDGTAGVEVKGDGGSNDGYIQLNCSQNSHGIKLKSPPHSASQSYTLTFPSTAPATDKFLQTNSSGVLSFADAGGGITEADNWRLTANLSGDHEPIASSTFERCDNTGYSKIGTGMSYDSSSGLFTFGATGLYYVVWNWFVLLDSATDSSMITYLQANISGSVTNLAQGKLSGSTSDHTRQMGTISAMYNVTNVSTHKLQINVNSMNNNDTRGDTNYTTSGITFIRLGDSQ